MTRGLSQKQRILLALRRNPDRGVDQTMFLAPHVCDGGPPITRVAARVKDLRDEGFPIRDGGSRNKCAVYILDQQALERQLSEPVHPRPAPAGEPSDALFDPAVGAAPPRSAYESEAA